MVGIEWLVSPGAAATMMSTSKPIMEFCCTESIARFRLEEPSWESSVRLFSSRSHACHLGFHLAQQLRREDRGTGQAKGSQGQVPRLGCVIYFFSDCCICNSGWQCCIILGGEWCGADQYQVDLVLPLAFLKLERTSCDLGGKISSQAFIQSYFEYNSVVFIRSY